MRVLLVEDEFALATSLARGLENHGITTEIAGTGEAAIERLDREEFEVVVLDRRLPGLSGDDVCRWLRERRGDARILMLTAADEIEDRVAGLSAGADDYVGKPVALAELVARIEALDRRRGGPPEMGLKWGDVVLHRDRQIARRDDREIRLTSKEFAVLEELVRARGAIVPLTRLERSLWGPGEVLANTVRATVMRVRRKLGDPPCIETITGVGYRLE
jgi:DNA-binding response OmpR family regulator